MNGDAPSLSPDREEALFREAIQLEAGPARAAYLDQVCGNDPILRERLAALIQAHESVTPFLEPPVAGATAQTIQFDFAAAEEGVGSRIGRYKLLQVIGEGGMGVVYMAEQEEPVRRRVAVKIIKLGMDTKQVIARFEAERQALAIMDHPNIARVLDGGTTPAGRPYFVMELVQGVPITEFCDRNKVSAEERLKIFIPVCQAIQSAHQKGIIHRDVKPTNVLVTLHHGAPMPKVIDFGIAKAINQKLTEKTLFTQHASMIGTPAYMSPEQAEISSLDVDTRTDVYALGVLLYELLTGTTPFSPKRLLSLAYGELQRVIMEEEPERPSTRLSTMDEPTKSAVARNTGEDLRELRQWLRGDLDWIVMKCLEKDRTRRYETANGLALDIQRYLRSEPVLARPPSRLYRFRKLALRNKLAFAAVFAVTMSLLLGLWVSMWQAMRATRAEAEQSLLRKKAEVNADVARTAQLREADQRKNAELEKKKAGLQELAARKQAYAADMNLACREWHDGNLAAVLELLDAHRPKPGQPEMRGWEWRLLWMLSRSGELYEFAQLPGSVTALTVSPDGRKLVTGGNVASGEIGVRLWDINTRTQLANLEDALGTAAFSAGGEQIAYGTRPGGVKVRHIAKAAVTHEFPTDPGFHGSALAFSDDGRCLAFAQNNRSVSVVRLEDHSTLMRATTSANLTEGQLLFANGGKTLVFVGVGGVESWSVPDGQTRSLWKVQANSISSFALSPDGATFVLGTTVPPQVRVTDLKSSRTIAVLTNHSYSVNALVFSPDGKTLASGSGDHTIRLWHTPDWKEIDTLQGSKDEIFALAFSPNGRLLFSGAKDGTVKVWPAQRIEPRVGRVRLPEDAEYFGVPLGSRHPISRHANKTLRVWDPVTLEPRGPFRDPFSELPEYSCFEISPSGDLLLLAAKNGEIIVWDLSQERQRARLPWVPSDEVAGAFSLDGLRFAFANRNRVTIWELESLREIASIPKSPSAPAVLSFDRDGYTVAVGGRDGTVEVLSQDIKRRSSRWKAHRQMVRDLAFVPGKNQFVTSSRDSTLKLWDEATQQELESFERTQHTYRKVAISPDGLRLAASAADKYIRILDLITHRELMRIQVGEEGAYYLEFSPDGSTLLIVTEKELSRWHAPSWEEIQAAEAKDRMGSGQP